MLLSRFGLPAFFSCHHNDLVNSPSNKLFFKDSLLDLLATGGLLGGVVGFLLSQQSSSVQFIRSFGRGHMKQMWREIRR